MKVGDMVRPSNGAIGLVVRVEWGARCSTAWFHRNNGFEGKGKWRQLYAHVRSLEENSGEDECVCEDKLEVISESR